MEEQRRLFLAIALSLLVVTGWRYLVAPPPAPESRQPAPQTTIAPTDPVIPAPLVAQKEVARQEKASAEVRPESDETEKRIEIQGPDVTIAFTNRGARLISWRLRRFKDKQGREEELVVASSGELRPLDIETGRPDVDSRLRTALFRASVESVTANGSGADITFRFAETDLAVEKAFHAEPNGYLVSVTAKVQQGGLPVPVRLVWGPGLGNPTSEEKAVQGYQEPRVVALVGGSVERVAVAKLTQPRPLDHVSWLGVETNYFVALIVPPTGAGQLRTQAAAGREGGPPHAAIAADLGQEGSPAVLYVGPKDYLSLAKLGHGFSRVVPIGDWIGPIVVLVMHLLRRIHGLVGSYGWSIVVLTVLINLAMAPLRHFSIANGLKMAKLAPEMKVIQDRYRGIPALDKRREQMQREIAELYGKHGMNMGTQMAMGCMPLVLTFPFLIAIYRVLQVSVELRGATFLWIPDLSQKDPLFLTPLLMGASMFLMQKMTPSTMDPSQQRMMMIMPLVFMVMFFAAPAGLNVYWLASNVCSIIQQGITLKVLKPTPAVSRQERRRP